jgi:hypothetical protein
VPSPGRANNTIAIGDDYPALPGPALGASDGSTKTGASTTAIAGRVEGDRRLAQSTLHTLAGL